MNIKGLDHVNVSAPEGSEEKARKFYGDILELKEVDKPAPLDTRGGVWFQVGNQQLHIGIDKDFIAAKRAHPAFEVTDLNKIRKRLIEHNVKVIDDDDLKGADRLFCYDPYGNRLELLEWI